jgi:hypothetical protein
MGYWTEKGSVTSHPFYSGGNVLSRRHAPQPPGHAPLVGSLSNSSPSTHAGQITLDINNLLPKFALF